MSVKQGGNTIAGASTTDTANKNLSNLNSQGQNIANWSTNVANCITEIPQDIKLELNNGTLTLKAGSKVYAPNGKNTDGSLKFDEVVIESDLTLTGTTDGKYLFAVNYAVTGINMRLVSRCTSGAGATATSGFAYNTTTNIINNFTSLGVAGAQHCFPLGVITVSGGAISSIDQVFNGFGYIGSTVFALPGVKGLIPNGRNEDGSLNNIEFTTSSVLTQTWTNSNTYHNAVFSLNPVHISVQANGLFIQKDKPDANYCNWYNPNENLYYSKGAGEFEVKQEIWFSIVDWVSGRITSFNPKTPFHAVDTADLATKQDSATALTTTNTYYSGTTLYIG